MAITMTGSRFSRDILPPRELYGFNVAPSAATYAVLRIPAPESDCPRSETAASDSPLRIVFEQCFSFSKVVQDQMLGLDGVRDIGALREGEALFGSAAKLELSAILHIDNSPLVDNYLAGSSDYQDWFGTISPTSEADSSGGLERHGTARKVAEARQKMLVSGLCLSPRSDGSD